LIRDLRQHIKHFVCARPLLYSGWVRLMRPEKNRLAAAKGVECIIEGYPRSANTFAVVAFQKAGNGRIRLAHHTHVPATILYGCARDLPTVVLIRNPLDAVASAVIFSGQSPRLLLGDWIWFYRTCWDMRHKFIVADFDEVIGDFGEVTNRMNLRWARDFRPFFPNDENLAEVRSEIEAIARQHNMGEKQVARRSEEREKLKVAVKEELGQHERQLTEAIAIYEQYKILATGSPPQELEPSGHGTRLGSSSS